MHTLHKWICVYCIFYRSLFLQFKSQFLAPNSTLGCSPLGGGSSSLLPDLRDGPSWAWLGVFKLVVETQISTVWYDQKCSKYHKLSFLLFHTINLISCFKVPNFTTLTAQIHILQYYKLSFLPFTTSLVPYTSILPSFPVFK